jgi:formate dehydrogenase accessory protein FdhD
MPKSESGRPALGYAAPSVRREYTRIGDGPASPESAIVAEEVPVALVYNGQSHVVVMASPADLEDLGFGFSITEGIVANPEEIERVDVVRHSRGIEVQMIVPMTVSDRLGDRRRAISSRTGCGICGVDSIDAVLRAPVRVTAQAAIPDASLWQAAAALEAHQPLNNETRAVHAAAYASRDGDLEIVREDVGRHNALDKVIGALVRQKRTAADGFLIVTSRASYELVQKAAVVQSPLLAAVSRPTNLAIELAEQAGIRLVGLLRGRTANIYT